MNLLKRVASHLRHHFICWILIGIGGLLIVGYVLLTQVDIPGKIPLHNKPDEIRLYKYGQKAVYTAEDDAYSQLYECLRPYAYSKVWDWLGGDITMGSWQAQYYKECMIAQEEGIVVESVYSSAQSIRQEGYDEYYCNLLYLIEYPEKPEDDPDYFSDTQLLTGCIYYHPVEPNGTIADKLSCMAPIPDYVPAVKIIIDSLTP